MTPHVTPRQGSAVFENYEQLLSQPMDMGKFGAALEQAPGWQELKQQLTSGCRNPALILKNICAIARNCGVLASIIRADDADTEAFVAGVLGMRRGVSLGGELAKHPRPQEGELCLGMCAESAYTRMEHYQVESSTVAAVFNHNYGVSNTVSHAGKFDRPGGVKTQLPASTRRLQRMAIATPRTMAGVNVFEGSLEVVFIPNGMCVDKNGTNKVLGLAVADVARMHGPHVAAFWLLFAVLSAGTLDPTKAICQGDPKIRRHNSKFLVCAGHPERWIGADDPLTAIAPTHYAVTVTHHGNPPGYERSRSSKGLPPLDPENEDASLKDLLDMLDNKRASGFWSALADAQSVTYVIENEFGLSPDELEKRGLDVERMRLCDLLPALEQPDKGKKQVTRKRKEQAPQDSDDELPLQDKPISLLTGSGGSGGSDDDQPTTPTMRDTVYRIAVQAIHEHNLGRAAAAAVNLRRAAAAVETAMGESDLRDTFLRRLAEYAQNVLNSRSLEHYDMCAMAGFLVALARVLDKNTHGVPASSLSDVHKEKLMVQIEAIESTMASWEQPYTNKLLKHLQDGLANANADLCARLAAIKAFQHAYVAMDMSIANQEQQAPAESQEAPAEAQAGGSGGPGGSGGAGGSGSPGGGGAGGSQQAGGGSSGSGGPGGSQQAGGGGSPGGGGPGGGGPGGSQQDGGDGDKALLARLANLIDSAKPFPELLGAALQQCPQRAFYREQLGPLQAHIRSIQARLESARGCQDGLQRALAALAAAQEADVRARQADANLAALKRAVEALELVPEELRAGASLPELQRQLAQLAQQQERAAAEARQHDLSALQQQVAAARTDAMRLLDTA